MLKIGVTGGIGSGKTTVCEIFNALGVPVYNSDIRAKEIMVEDPNLIKDLKESFGEDIYVNKSLDKKKLAGIVFKDKAKLALLNSLVHPAVGRDYQNWLQHKRNHKYTIKEAALIFEAGIHKNLDKTILVTCPQEIRMNRVVSRDSITEEEVLERIKNQWSEDKKMALADYRIINDGKHSLIKQILSLHQEIQKL